MIFTFEINSVYNLYANYLFSNIYNKLYNVHIVSLKKI